MKYLILILLCTCTLYSQWFQQNSGTNLSLNDAYFHSVLKGWACGDRGIILRTTDGGTQWHHYMYDSNYTMNNICFVNESTGFVSGTYYQSWQFRFSKVFKTTDGGLTWNQLLSHVGYNDGRQITSLDFYDVNNGIVTLQGSNGFASKGDYLSTTNGGLNWVSHANTGSLNFDKVIFTGSFTIYLLAQYWVDTGQDTHYVYKSTDAGISWQTVYKKSHAGIKNMFYSNGVISLTGQKPQSSNGILIRSINNGASWDTLINGIPPVINSAYFMNQNTGWRAGSSGNILYTDNGGASWSSQLQGGAFNVYYIQMFNSCTGWAIGSNGIIFKTITCGLTSIIPISNEIPRQFSLSQNYPNPFNPTTNFQFQIPYTGFVKLTVFDLLGREIQTLVDQHLSPGTYNADFDASSLPSGVYYYKLETEEFTETKKMILIK